MERERRRAATLLLKRMVDKGRPLIGEVGQKKIEDRYVPIDWRTTLGKGKGCAEGGVEDGMRLHGGRRIGYGRNECPTDVDRSSRLRV